MIPSNNSAACSVCFGSGFDVAGKPCPFAPHRDAATLKAAQGGVTEAMVDGPALLQIARDVGLREVMFNVSAERATPLLQAFFAAALSAQQGQGEGGALPAELCAWLQKRDLLPDTEEDGSFDIADLIIALDGHEDALMTSTPPPSAPPAQPAEPAAQGEAVAYVCSNPACGVVHAVDPCGHCPACVQESGAGWSTIPRKYYGHNEQAADTADALIRELGLDPERFRTEAGFLNSNKLRAAILYPSDYAGLYLAPPVQPAERVPEGESEDPPTCPICDQMKLSARCSACGYEDSTPGAAR